MFVTLSMVATACDGKSGTNDNDTDNDTDNDNDCPRASDCEESDTSTDGDPVITGPHGGRMILIPAGSFDMGCTAGQSEFDCAQAGVPTVVMPVTLTHDYYIGETEVTKAEYEAVMGTLTAEGNCGSRCPLVSGSWHEAAAYANALSSSAGLTECYTCSGSQCDASMSPYDCDGYRLPTEAEWEGAARCGEDLLYAGSNNINAVANYCEGWGSSDSFAVCDSPTGYAEKAPNACGLYDMSGSLAEWTQDWYGSSYYTADGRTDPYPEEPDSRNSRVLRGGAAVGNPKHCRVASREFDRPERGYSWGFRLARTLP
jgi:formylglycine-generating enzyme required for sulfatase activity